MDDTTILDEAAQMARDPTDPVAYFESLSLPVAPYKEHWAAWASAAARVGNVGVLRHIHERRTCPASYGFGSISPVDRMDVTVAALRGADYDVVAYVLSQFGTR